MHHMSLRQGLRSFSAKRRRTVSRETPSCSVSLTSSPANRLQRPTAAACRWLGTGGGDEQGLLLAREFAARSRARFFVERRFQVAEHEAAFGAVHGGPARANAPGNFLVAGSGIGRQ